VLVIDDHRVYAEVVAARLRLEPGIERVEVALSVEEARVVLRSFAPQVVLLDNDLGGVLGTAFIPELKSCSPASRVVMVSGTDDIRSIVESLEAGAEAWVGKDARFEILVQAIADVLEGNMYLYPRAVEPVLRRLLHEREAQHASTFIDDLSPRELDVLRCLIAGMTRAEVAQRLFISPNTVRTHVQHLLRHAQVHSTVALVAAARSAGLTSVDDPRRAVERRSVSADRGTSRPPHAGERPVYGA
jgi:two-component system nitrate/nitrite response regulator NarL